MSRNLKLTTSDNQLLTESHTLLQGHKTTIKEITSSNFGAIESKQKIKVDHKAFNVKLTKYKRMQTHFTNACHNLIKSYKLMKNIHLDTLTNKNDPELEELDATIKNIIEEQFGIQFPKLYAPLKNDHQQYVSSLNTPNSFVINSTSRHLKLHSAIKETYEYVSNIISKISDTTKMYNFWLMMIIQPDKFYDLDDVRAYLVQNMVDNAQMYEQLECDNYHESLKCKLINIMNEFNEVLEPKKNDECKIKEVKMNTKINKLEAKHEKLKVTESEYCKQIKALLGELAFRNRKLNNAENCLASLTKEKYDLISMIEKMEVKSVDFQLLQKDIEKEQEKNQHLTIIIDEEFEKKIVNY